MWHPFTPIHRETCCIDVCKFMSWQGWVGDRQAQKPGTDASQLPGQPQVRYRSDTAKMHGTISNEMARWQCREGCLGGVVIDAVGRQCITISSRQWPTSVQPVPSSGVMASHKIYCPSINMRSNSHNNTHIKEASLKGNGVLPYVNINLQWTLCNALISWNVK